MKIAIFGPLCSGKSTLANHISCYMEKKYYQEVTKVSFGEMIYEIAYKLFDMKKKDRKLLQDIGRKMRDIDEDIFTKYTMRKIAEMGPESHILIEDARLLSEFHALKEAGFYFVYLMISREKQIERIKKTYPDTWESHVANLEHSSETEMRNLPLNEFHLVVHVDDNETMTESLMAMIVENARMKS
jgi:adenylate kinase family enzyme